MNTWNGAHPPELPLVTPAGRLAGVLRMTAFVSMTVVALPLFIAGRYLRAWLGHRVTYHFLIARLWSRAGLWLIGLRLVVRGKPVAGGALVANHCSWADILTLRAVKLMYFVAKAEVRSWPAIAGAGSARAHRRQPVVAVLPRGHLVGRAAGAAVQKLAVLRVLL
jgi:1-acyl-sn-glycerol-3-phosphate acyltransferase